MFGFFRRSANPNTLVGVFLLVLLAVFAGPGMLPNLLPSLVPGADESIRCEWLRSGEQRAQHQSLIGREADDSALSLKVRSSALPNQPGQNLEIVVVITNRSIGTVAINYNVNQVQIGDGGLNGLGIAFNAPNPQAFGGAGGGGSYPEEDIRLLGPRQSCIHREVFPYEQIPSLGLGIGQNIVKAYYRNTTRGVVQLANGAQQLIYPDQGLWVGIAESESIPIVTSSG
ncbi:MAG: hypothetical protein K8L97_29310 [Anaerolineae bacterium]|nr:hypothetical protein [Anaerolineae bacterium]